MATLDEKIAKLQAWCKANYKRGADTMIECRERADYERLLSQCEGSPRRALKQLKQLAGVYSDQQADARHHRAEACASAVIEVAAPAADPDATIAAALAILQARISAGPVVGTPSTVRDYLRLHFAGSDREVFAVMLLDAYCRVISTEALFTGTLSQVSVYPREVVKLALAKNAAAVILCHNHPSGVPEPSRADEHITTTLKSALALIDVRVLDHVIVAAGSTVSMAERGLL